jgi:C1A family cysteine protease
MLKKIFILPVIAFLSIICLSTFLCADELGYIQATIQSSGARWEAGETSISKLPSYERRMRLGALKPILTGEESLLSTQTDRALGLPTRFDWRNYNLENFVTPVRDQGNCGSC